MAQPARAHGAIGKLPEHLFVDILALLQSHEIAQAYRVCKGWSIVARTPYLWRHLSFISIDQHCIGKFIFTEVKPGSKMPWDKIIARAQGSVLSVEFAYVAHHQIYELARALKLTAALSIRHIRWSVPSGWRSPSVTAAWIRDAAWRVLELAQACPNVRTVEIMCQWKLEPLTLFMEGALRSVQLQRFRTDAPLSDEVRIHLLTTLSKAKTVILYKNEELGPYNESWLSELLSSNTVIEELLCHHIADDDNCQANNVTTSLSLKRLDWKPSSPVWRGTVMLHAPNLRELTTEARLLCKLSDESLSNLARLSVDVLPEPTLSRYPASLLRSAPIGLQGLQRIASHAGELDLTYGPLAWKEFPLFLVLLASDLIWPGLTRVTFTLVGDLVNLPCLIAARRAAARGASREQYMAIASGSTALAMSSSTAAATYDGASLCRDTHWTVFDGSRCMSAATIAWLKGLDNVNLYL